MLTETDLERLFIDRGIPRTGRELIREIRQTGPVRNVQKSMNSVRVRHVSRKMGRALLAESRTVEFPGIYYREFDDETLELWPQACRFDLLVDAPSGGRTRIQHTPDLFLVREGEFLFEEWREEKRLEKLAEEMPHRYYKDSSGRWHDVIVEKHVEAMNIRYHLRSADEHPREWLSNMQVLADYTLENTPPVPHEERERLLKLMQAQRRVSHLELIDEHQFSADHIFQMVLLKDVYVDLHETLIHQVDDLVIYSDEVTGKADAILKQSREFASPSCAVNIEPGLEFAYDGQPYHVVLVGNSEVKARTPTGQLVQLKLSEVRDLVKGRQLTPVHPQMTAPEVDEQAVINSKRLVGALKRLNALRNPENSKLSARTIRFLRAKTRGLQTDQQVLLELMSKNPGNTHQRIPDLQLELAKEAAKTFHNKENAPTVSASYSVYVDLAEAAGKKPMARSSFYELMKRLQSTKDRHGKKRAYQEEPLRLHADYKHPVHGVLPHEVVYIDHTPLPIFLRGRRLRNLGKPTLTLATDGALACPRAFFLGFKTARTLSVLMCLRDYVRRHGCLPRIIVVDNGKEFHSRELEAFASLFAIDIRWRRASQPRDSSRVERALGVTQQEVTDNLKGNSKSLRDPRDVSATHNPENFTESTLKSLHGSLNNYFFTTLMQRVHPVFGVPPLEREEVLNRELGARMHRAIAFDNVFKLLTSPRPKLGKPRKVDSRRGVWVDGAWHWHPSFALAKPRETVDVRIEPWNARVVYACFRDNWLLATARDGGVLHGRFHEELEYQRREERREALAAAQRDKATPRHARQRRDSWMPEKWDEFLREQCVEEYRTYQALGMVEAYEEATNADALALDFGLPKRTVEAHTAELPEPATTAMKAASLAAESAGRETPAASAPADDEEVLDEEAF